MAAGEKKALSFTSNAAFSDFIRVEIDSKTLDGTKYSVKEGSTIVTLKAEYIAGLSVGEHTIGIVSESGTAEITFTVTARKGNKSDASQTEDNKSASQRGDNSDAPETGDNSRMALWLVLLLASGGLLLVTGVFGRKKKRSAK